MPRRNQHNSEELRELAVQAVVRIAESGGAQAVTARSVAREIGYTPGMLYHVFDDRDDMILHANVMLLDELAQSLDEASGRKRADRALEAICLAYLSLAREKSARWQLLFEHRMKDGAPVPAWYQSRIARLFDIVESRFRQLDSSRPSAEAGLAARTLWSAVHGVCLLAVTGKLDIGGPVPPEKMVSSLARHYARGWLAAD